MENSCAASPSAPHQASGCAAWSRGGASSPGTCHVATRCWLQPVRDYTLKGVTFHRLLLAAPSVFLLAFNSKVPEKASRPSSSPWEALFIR